ncbi:MAG: WYL domain-containing protein [Crocinitomicaceae bacterium]|nr:WYL domain-containing protein [Crocinitomicaceae bacterium]
MSKIKNAQLRYRVIDRCLRNSARTFPSKDDLRKACEEALYGSTGGSDICDSTIEKDMFAMREEFDAPIKYSKVHKGYFYDDPEFSIEKIPLSEDDIDAIKFATKTLMQFKDLGIFKNFGYAIGKIFDRVHITDNPLDSAVDKFVQFETVSETPGSELLPVLLKAIKDKSIVTFDYAGYATEKAKARKVLPLLLKEYRNRWYLICFAMDKGKVITFGLDRIKNLLLTKEHHYKPVDFDPDHYFKHSIGITANETEPEEIHFKMDKVGSKYIESQPLHASQRLVKEGANRNTFELKVIVSEELKRTILSYGAQIEVIKPKALRSEIQSIANAMQETYL